jgi:hypothetical protein
MKLRLVFLDLYKRTLRQMKISVGWENQQPITAFIRNLKLCSRLAKTFSDEHSEQCSVFHFFSMRYKLSGSQNTNDQATLYWVWIHTT